VQDPVKSNNRSERVQKHENMKAKQNLRDASSFPGFRPNPPMENPVREEVRQHLQKQLSRPAVTTVKLKHINLLDTNGGRDARLSIVLIGDGVQRTSGNHHRDCQRLAPEQLELWQHPWRGAHETTLLHLTGETF
jgi:hypothetical protein